MRKRLFYVTFMFLLVGVLFTSFYILINQNHNKVEFIDENFEQAIRTLLNQPTGSIDASQVDDITTLILPNEGIEYLDGIEMFTSLRILQLEGNHIKDVSPLSSLLHLENLNLRDNKITSLSNINFSSLQENSQLKELNLRHNVIRPDELDSTFTVRLSDISLLSSFISLEVLILRDNHIQNIEPIENLTEITYLDISQNPISSSNLDYLSKLTKLQHLNLKETNLSTIDGLSRFSFLTYLNLHSNRMIESVSPLRNMVQLETLILENVPVKEEIIYLFPLTNLRRLNLKNTGITDVSVLASLMDYGALQDNVINGVIAEVDISDNPIPIVDGDDSEGYNPLKNYWSNITYRSPQILPVDPSREIVINEYMTSNGDILADVDGDYPDWIELYNPSSTDIDISGYFISDDPDNPFRFQFPNNTIIEANEYLIIFASGKNKTTNIGEIHTNFSLSRDGEPIIITSSDTLTLVDQVFAIKIPRNISYGRYFDGTSNWVFFDRSNITPMRSNNTAQPYDLPDWLNPNLQ